MLPVLMTVTSPLPLWVRPVMVSGAAVSVNCTVPTPVFVALKLDTVFAALKLKPVTETVVNKAPLLITPAPLSLKLPVLLSETLPPLALIEPVTFRLPVLLTVISPLPFCAMLVMVKG